MPQSFTKRTMIVVATGLVLSVGGCPIGFENALPSNLDASLRYILDHAADFQQDATPYTDVGIVRDDLANLSGCWGALLAGVAGTGSAGRMDAYSLLCFGPGDRLATWDVSNIGGVTAAVYAGTGRFEVVAPGRLRFTFEQRRYYNPLTRAYETVTAEGEITEWLATLDGDRLYLLMLDEPGAEPDPGDTQFTIVYHRFACRE